MSTESKNEQIARLQRDRDEQKRERGCAGMSRYRRPEEEFAAINDMLRYGRLSAPATLILLVIGVLWSVHIAVIAIAASALAVQAGILIYAGLRRRKLIRQEEERDDAGE